MVFKFLNESQFWTYSELESHQYIKLKELLDFAYRHSSFYSKKFKIFGVCPIDIKSIEDLKNLPITIKEDLLNNNSEVHSKYKFDKLFFSETSGTSGQVLKFYKNLEWDNF